MKLVEILKVIFLGIVEGITEWLPVSSTGHMLLVDEFIQLSGSDRFKEIFFVMIQLGAIIAVLIQFWDKMWPFKKDKDTGRIAFRMPIFRVWLKVVVACIPGTIVTLLFDDYIEAHLHTPVVIALALIVYGVAFLLIESDPKKPKVKKLSRLKYRTALYIGLFQVLSVIPGTSRSGSTILGALLLGVSRTTAAEFTFFIAVPVMFGLSGVKLLKLGFAFTGAELAILLIGMVTAFAVSMFVVRFLMAYVRKHDFKIFGWYRIALGAIVLLYFLVFK